MHHYIKTLCRLITIRLGQRSKSFKEEPKPPKNKVEKQLYIL